MTARTISQMQSEMDEQSELGNIGAVMDLVDEMGNLEDKALSAIASGNLKEVKQLEALGVNIHGGSIAFYRKAIRSGHLEMVRYFLDRGADPNSHNGSPLFQAASLGDADVFNLLVEYGADPTTNTAGLVEQAAKFGSVDVIKAVIERDKSFRDSDNDILGYACLFGHFAVVRYLLEAGISSRNLGDINNAYLDAIGTADLTIIQYLTEQGAEIDLAIQAGNSRTRKWAEKWKAAEALKSRLEDLLPEVGKVQPRGKI